MDQESPFSVDSLAISPNGSRLASGYAGGRVRLWNTETYEAIVSFAVKGEGNMTLTWSPDGSRLAVGGSFSPVQILETDKGTALRMWEGADRRR